MSYRLAMRSFLALAVMLLLSGCAPSDIARGSCESHPLTIGDEWSCTVKGAIVGQPSAVEFSTESRNHVAEVSMAFQVTEGTLRIRYSDLSGGKSVLVTPSEPADITMKTQMSPNDRSFMVHFEPINGPAEGLTGTVKYSTP
jgi:hypothetical protein